MRSALLIAGREFTEHIRTKGFWLGLFLFPCIWLLAIRVPQLLEKKGTPSRHFVMIDQTGNYEQLIERRLAQNEARRTRRELAEYMRRYARDPNAINSIQDSSGPDSTNVLEQIRPLVRSNAPPFRPSPARFIEVRLPEELGATNSLEYLEERIRPWLRGDGPGPVGKASDLPAKLFAAVLIPSGFDSNSAPAPVRYWSDNQADTGLRDEIERVLTTELRRKQYTALGLDQATIRRVESLQAPITAFNPRKSRGTEQVVLADMIRQWAPSAFVYFLMVALMVVGQMLLHSVVEEKSSRVVEVLLSSVRPGELMGGKLLGVGAIGLVMLGAWLITLAGVVWWSASSLSPESATAAANTASELPRAIGLVLRESWLLPAFILYFLLGYVLYASLFLILGASCNTVKDAQSYMGITTLVLMLPMFTLIYIPRDPNGPIATTLSWIPLYTPFVMLNRIMADPPLRDVIGTFVLLIISIAVALWAAARVFRVGILRTGQPPRLIELLRWMRSRE